MQISAWLFAISLAANVFCLAVNAYTWRLAYPLWAFAGDAFPRVHREYLARLTPVITVPHVLLFFASLGAAIRPIFGIARWSSWLVFGLDAAVVVVSIAVAGPVHDRFTRCGFDPAGLVRLVHVSAWRTVALGAACAMLLWRVASNLTR